MTAKDIKGIEYLTSQELRFILIVDLSRKESVMEKRVLGKSISILHRREQKYMMHRMKEYGIGYSSYNFLMFLAYKEGCSQREMCEGMSVDEALAVRVVKKLQEDNYIRREKSKEDGKRYEIYLTEAGWELIPKLRECLTQWWEQVLSELTEEDKLQTIKNLEKIAEKSALVLDKALK